MEVKKELELYNAYLIGNVYGYVIEHKEKWTNEKGEEKYEWETDDSGRGYYELKDILDEVKEFSPIENK